MLRTTGLSLAAMFLVSGCAHTRLAQNSVEHARTLSEVQEQQVLDNLALICNDPGAIPHFAVPSGGATGVSENKTGTAGFGWNATGLTSITSGVNGTLGLTENWTLTPVNNPKKIDLIRCVLLYATGRVDTGQCDPCCDSCVTKLQRYFGPDWCSCDLPPPGFFTISPEEPASDECCVKFGEHCRTIVCVDKCRFHHLSKLTLAILDIATISDETIASRLSGREEQIEVKESFIALVDGKLRLIEGEYSLDKSDYERLQGRGLKSQKGVSVFDMFGPGVDALFDSDTESFKPNLRAPMLFPGSAETRERSSEFESLIQLNNQNLVSPPVSPQQ